MIVIIHRINKIEGLKTVPEKYGVEVDIRGYGKKLFLNHEPIVNLDDCDELEDYLKEFKHAFIIFNIKEAGYEGMVISLAEKYGLENYFLLDVEFPYFYRATRKDKFRKIAVRYSEAEPIEFVEAQIKGGIPLIDWVWIDTNTILPLNEEVMGKLNGLKSCLVCPERWGRPEDISVYIEKIKSLGFNPDAVMTSKEHAKTWEKSFEEGENGD